MKDPDTDVNEGTRSDREDGRSRGDTSDSSGESDDSNPDTRRGAADRDGPSSAGDIDFTDDPESPDDVGDPGAGTGIDIEELVLDDGSDEPDEASRGLFDDLLEGEPIFENKEVLRPSYTPHRLPHREEQINNMATILVTALRGDTPSNILIYGKTGTGKTASAKFVSEELESTSKKFEVPCEVEYINCEVTDTQYRVLAQLANKFIDKNEAAVEARLEELREAEDRLDAGQPERAAGICTVTEAVIEHIEGLYDQNQYSVMLRSLRG